MFWLPHRDEAFDRTSTEEEQKFLPKISKYLCKDTDNIQINSSQGDKYHRRILISFPDSK